jgi:hypothetical protein
MLRKKKGFLAAAGIAAVALSGAAAFTNSISSSNTNTTVGYLSENVSGANVSSINYTLSADGSTIDDVTFVTDTDTTGSQAEVGFSVGGVAQPLDTSGTDCQSTANTPSSPKTTWACTLDTPISVASVTAVNIVIS